MLKLGQILDTTMLPSVIQHRNCWLPLGKLGWTSAAGSNPGSPEPVQGIHVYIYIYMYKLVCPITVFKASLDDAARCCSFLITSYPRGTFCREKVIN